MPSRTRPVLISSLGRRIVAIGRLSYAGALGYATAFDPGYRRHNSAQRLHSLRRALTVPDDLAAAVKANAGAGLVLLVDDQIDSGWTMTVAAMLLRKAGASGVLPLALAVTAG
jgi:ATP-dependent DNA helicase RecQ